MLTTKKISITIPAYNEEETIKEVSRQALSSVAKLTKRYELLLVNDGSTDGTARKMNELKNEHPGNVVIIHHKKNQGFTGAMKTCYMHASGDFIFLGPADGQFDYSELKIFVNAIKGYDIVVGYTAVNPESLSRKFYSLSFHLIVKLLFGIRLKEFSRCILYTKKVRDSIIITSDSFSCLFLPELLYRSIKKDYKIEQVPFHLHKRKGGVRKGTNFRMILKTLHEIITFWFDMKVVTLIKK